jgi:hypothetical protein
MIKKYTNIHTIYTKSKPDRLVLVRTFRRILNLLQHVLRPSVLANLNHSEHAY